MNIQEELKFLQKRLAIVEEERDTLRISQSSTHKTLLQLNDELLKIQKQFAQHHIDFDQYFLKELIEEINQDFEKQSFDSKWKNQDGTEFVCDVSSAYSWWFNYREYLKSKYLRSKKNGSTRIN